jgi:3-dehydroquinate synthase class II
MGIVLTAVADRRERESDVYIARTRPGTDFPTRLETLLSQRDGQWSEVISAFDDAEEDVDAKSEEEGEDGVVLPSPRRVTVRDVLKYSLS